MSPSLSLKSVPASSQNPRQDSGERVIGPVSGRRRFFQPLHASASVCGHAASPDETQRRIFLNRSNCDGNCAVTPFNSGGHCAAVWKPGAFSHGIVARPFPWPIGLEPSPSFTRSGLRVVSASSPSRNNSRGTASISPSDVWKFTMQALNTKLCSGRQQLGLTRLADDVRSRRLLAVSEPAAFASGRCHQIGRHSLGRTFRQCPARSQRLIVGMREHAHKPEFCRESQGCPHMKLFYLLAAR